MADTERNMMIRLGEKLARERDAGHDLWTWLPSHKAAQAGHGDYASEHMPSMEDLLREAAIYLGHDMKPTPEQLAENEFYQCPCGEGHAK